MALQYISDDAGNQTAVVIPINQWNEITARHEDIKELTAPKANPATSKKPSDYAGTMSKEEGETFSQYIEQSRNELERNF
ncbi:hypothetical protein [Mucilaginibacter glaciei]|nr:hypothetical protein [Mucilaginibacter glaciei]